jgi:hypothetical protein
VCAAAAVSLSLTLTHLPPLPPAVQMVKPLIKPNQIVKKRNKDFKRHQADKYVTMNVRLPLPPSISHHLTRILSLLFLYLHHVRFCSPRGASPTASTIARADALSARTSCLPLATALTSAYVHSAL